MRGAGPPRGLLAPRVQLLALDLARGSKAEALDDERIVVLFLALLIGPVVGAHTRFNDQLIALARGARENFTGRAEGCEPYRRDGLARRSVLVLARVVVTH